jgi:prepilin-type N-terminal cleavage/methylation domain-containing protein
MIKKEAGFTLIELMVTMVIFVLAIAAASQMFIGQLTQFKQQGKIAETNIEGIIGLELLRRDVEHAGYGLPWNPTPLPVYAEAVNDAATAHNDTLFNDSPTNAPRAILNGDGIGVNGSDVLVIKAVNVAINAAAHRWTRLGAGNDKRNGLSGDNFANNDRVIVISPGNTDANRRTLVNGLFNATYNTTLTFAPADNTETYIIYGVDDNTNLIMPFNRADYYIRTPAANMPSRCATGTGILYKATVNQNGGGLWELPILDCVADMQVDYQLDLGPVGAVDGIIDTTTDTLAGYTAEQIRQVKEVRVYILAHEGQRSISYTFTNFTPAACPTCIRVGRDAVLGQDFDLIAIADFQNYRWKVYTIVVKTNNLGGK